MTATAPISPSDLILSACRVLFSKGQTVELRVPKAGKHGTISGFFDNGRDLVAAATELSGTVPGVYITLNPVSPELLERSPNRLTYNAKKGEGAKDQHIIARRWLPVDFDAVRPADTSSTDAEHDSAMERARRASDYLAGLGWPEPVVASSGNGAHLLYRIDTPNDDAAKAAVRGVLAHLKARFSDEAVTVDTTVSNAARIWKLYGTLSAKGAATDERPHRVARLLFVPPQLGIVSLEQMQALIPPEPERVAAQPQPSSDKRLRNFAMAALLSAEDRIRTAPKGTRNSTLNTEAFGVAQLVGAGLLSETVAFATIKAAADGTGMTSDEIKATLASAWGDGLENPRMPEEKEISRKPPRREAPPPPPPPPEYGGRQWVDEETGEIFEGQPPGAEPVRAPEPPPPANDNIGPVSPFDCFTILGYDHEDVFIFQHEKRQLLVLNCATMSASKLIELAPLDLWALRYPTKTGFDKNAAVDEIFRRAHRMPVFNPSRIRGRGAWLDDERHLFHFGDRLLVDGQEIQLGKVASRFIYQAEVPFEVARDVPALTEDEGRQLLTLAERFRWQVPASSALLAGWVALAPLCGAIKWRPHIWLTGGAGCGKSTLLEQYVNQLTRWCNVYAQGNSTEAGIRQTLACDAVPVLFDESEQNNEREVSRVQNILALIRQASTESGAKTLKGTTTGNAMNFHIRSMFCLASIQVGIQQQADAERLTVLALRSKPEKGSADEASHVAEWNDLKEALYLLRRDETLPDRLFKRMLGRLPDVVRAIDVFTLAAARHFGNQREGDQYGTLLAGCWCLISDDAPSEADAASWIAAFDWTNYTAMSHGDDATRAMTALLESRLETPHNSRYSVFELCDAIAKATGHPRSTEEVPACGLELKDAQAVLQRHGMKVVKGRLMLSNNSEALPRLVAGTPFQADFRGLLSRVPGVERSGEVAQINGKAARCMVIPLSMIV